MARWIALVGLILAVGAGWWFLSRKGASDIAGAKTQASASGSRSGPQRPVPVQGIIVQPSAYAETVSLTGTVMANEAVDIVSDISGRIVSIGFAEGSTVKKGQLLVKLWDDDVQARLARARQQRNLDADRLQRLKELRPINGVSDQDFQVAVSTVAIRDAEVAELEAQISRTEIRAPFAGTVGLRSASVGAVLSPATIITSLRDESSLKLEFAVPERFAALVSNGSSIPFTVRGNDGVKAGKATVYATESAVNARTRTLSVRARLEGRTGIRAGMFADVQLTLNGVRDALLVPTESVTSDINGSFVYISRSGTAVRTAVELGGRTASHVRVVSGLVPGDTVITTGLLLLRRNTAVRVALGAGA
jgi:membrane fusion protein, multidrug efflux system